MKIMGLIYSFENNEIVLRSKKSIVYIDLEMFICLCNGKYIDTNIGMVWFDSYYLCNKLESIKLTELNKLINRDFKTVLCDYIIPSLPYILEQEIQWSLKKIANDC